MKYSPGNLTAVAYDGDKVAVAHTTRLTSGEATKIELSIDVPSAETGTGTALVLDGSDTALLRASILDAAGVVVHMASHNVSFRVVSGPGRVVGCARCNMRCEMFGPAKQNPLIAANVFRAHN
eukprot:SAG31_NODE_8678_length_1407_cov_2.000000_3_plen_122_part_01